MIPDLKNMRKALNVAQQKLLDQQLKISAQKTKLGQQKTKLASKDARILLLEELLRLEKAKRFGRSSEQYVDPNDPQGRLFDEAELDLCEGDAKTAPEDEPTEVTVPEHTRKARGKRKPLPDYLPVVRIEHELPEADLVGPNGEQYTKIGESISKQLDIIPATVQVLEHVRFKYAVKNREELGVKTAPITKQPIAKSIASSGLLAHVVQSKYEYHLPLYRQEQIWAALDVHLPRNSLCRWIIKLGELVKPLIEFQFEQMKLHHHIHVDETPVVVIDDHKKKVGKPSHNGYMWVYHNQYGTVFDYQSGRGGHHPLAMLEEFEGYVQTDAYSGYNALFTTGSNRQPVGCFAHARRKFTDVQKAAGKKKKSPIADYVIKLIAKLYKIEDLMKKEDLSIEDRYKYRQANAIPILKKLEEFLKDKRPKVPPKSLLGKAIAYALNNWPELHRYTDNGTLCIDNNLAERAIKPFAVGRKNWLFCGNTSGANASANLYSLIESAKTYNLKIFDYLKFVFEQINHANTPKKLEKLLPHFAHEHLPKMKNLKSS